MFYVLQLNHYIVYGDKMNIKYILKEIKKYLHWLLNPTMYTHVYKVSVDYSLITNKSLYNKHKINVTNYIITYCFNCGKKLKDDSTHSKN
jgi:hypothetical protein